jgi:hypothetical protein
MKYFILLLFPILASAKMGANEIVEIAPCKYYNEVHGYYDTCAPYRAVCKGSWVYVDAPSFGSFRKEFFSKKDAQEYIAEFEKTVAEWKKIQYTDLYDYNYTIILKPRCWLELPQ